jgi:cell division protein FtsW
MSAGTRVDASLLGRWWLTVDRWMLAALLTLLALGALMVLAASPAVAERLKLDSFHFAHRHLVFLVPSLIIMLTVSLLSPVGVRRLAMVVLGIGIVLMLATLVVGVEVKGARRWLVIAGFSIQPSEIVKPALAVVAAWLFTLQRQRSGIPGDVLSAGLFACVLLLLVMQPDFGMAFAATVVWSAQWFLAGLPLLWVGVLIAAGIGGLIVGYRTLDHVQSRIDRFLDPATGDTYQVDTALSAFSSGGLLGRGPGEGVIKAYLPDAHADFIFAVVGEEFGLVACLVLVALFAFVVLRGFVRLQQEEDLFRLLAAAGLLTLFGIQAVINMAVSLNLLPTKGMTLPFISYGGSSMLALAMGMGMVLALTRWRARPGNWP